MDQYQQFIAISRYSRWLDDENRRETWEETVDRYVDNVVVPALSKVKVFEWEWDGETLGFQDTVKMIREAILNLEVMPSMRGLMTAGEALNRDNTCLYNCAYTPIEKLTDFDKAMFILLCGGGVGFSVERQFINKLPEIPETFVASDTVIKVGDSKEGWCRSLRQYISLLYAGEIPIVDDSAVRGPGKRLKTFGGRSSGPQPLRDLFSFIKSTFNRAAGRKLNSLEVHDIMCVIGDIVVSGGVRRSAMLSLSNLSDDRMRHAKSGQWGVEFGQRALANNSVCYTEKPDIETFMREWLALVESKSGERGIFNRQGAKKKVESIGRRDPDWEFGTNPCSEIILRPRQFCNLTEVVARKDDDVKTLSRKVYIASILGTIQGTYTHFPYLGAEWVRNTEEERLLGVSITGIMDCRLLSNGTNDLKDLLEKLKSVAVDTNKRLATVLGIPQATATTCVKPSGTVSQRVDSSSGIHARNSEYYVRTVRGNNIDPITQFMVSQGFPNEPEARQPDKKVVFNFPIKSPEGAVTKKDMTAIDQLELWLIYQDHWCEHKPSITVYVRDDEWLEVGAFVYENFDRMSGVSFLPYSDHNYVQAPYQTCTEEEYEELLEKMPKYVDWGGLSKFETEDTTVGMKTLACTGDHCEIVDIGTT